MILHIGMHKTGTSSIQNSLASALIDPRFRFIQLGGMANGSLIMGNAYVPIDSYPHDPQAPLETRVAARRNAMIMLTTSLSEAGGQTPILSAELICSLSPESKEHLLDLLVRFHADLKVAAYLRRPKSYLQSAFQERLKHGFVPLKDFKQSVRYEWKFLPFERAIGRENVSIKLFSPEFLHEGCVVLDFARTWGIEIDRNRIKRDNSALSMEGVKLLYIYRMQNRSVRAEDPPVLDFCASITGKGLRLHSSICERAAQITDADIEWASERIGVAITDDWVEDDDCAITSETDLLAPTRRTIDLLARELDMPSSKLAGNPDAVAQALSALGNAAARNHGRIGRDHR